MPKRLDTSAEKRLAGRIYNLLDVYRDFDDLTNKYDQMYGESAIAGEPLGDVYDDALKACNGYQEMLGKRILAQHDYLLELCLARFDELAEKEEEHNERTS